MTVADCCMQFYALQYWALNGGEDLYLKRWDHLDNKVKLDLRWTNLVRQFCFKIVRALSSDHFYFCFEHQNDIELGSVLMANYSMS